MPAEVVRAALRSLQSITRLEFFCNSFWKEQRHDKASCTICPRRPGHPGRRGADDAAGPRSEIDLLWNAPDFGSTITGITVQRSDGSTWTTLASGLPATTTTYADRGVGAGTYFYRLLFTTAADGTVPPEYLPGLPRGSVTIAGGTTTYTISGFFQTVMGTVAPENVEPIIGGTVNGCPTACTALVHPDTWVTLTAHPSRGWVFTGWSNASGSIPPACPGTGPCKGQGAVAWTATFRRKP
jgi:Divergent InlB B-repeat domain